METPIAVRIILVVIGFGLIVGAELIDNVHARKPAATGSRQSDTLMDDAKVFMLRVAGALFIGIGLLMFVAAHKGTFL